MTKLLLSSYIHEDEIQPSLLQLTDEGVAAILHMQNQLKHILSAGAVLDGLQTRSLVMELYDDESNIQFSVKNYKCFTKELKAIFSRYVEAEEEEGDYIVNIKNRDDWNILISAQNIDREETELVVMSDFFYVRFDQGKSVSNVIPYLVIS